MALGARPHNAFVGQIRQGEPGLGDRPVGLVEDPAVDAQLMKRQITAVQQERIVANTLELERRRHECPVVMNGNVQARRDHLAGWRPVVSTIFQHE